MKIAMLLKSFMAGGVERNMLTLARLLIDRGHSVSLMVFKNQGPLGKQVDDRLDLHRLQIGNRITARALVLAADPLGAGSLLRPVLLPRRMDKAIRFLPDLARTLEQMCPDVVYSAMPYINLQAVWGTKLARSKARVILTEHVEVSRYLEERSGWRYSYLPPLMARTYSRADVIVSVSDGVGDDLALTTGLKRSRIVTVHNPIVGPELLAQASAPPDHPWFRPGEPPVVLNIGRLTTQKDHATLLRAFARARAVREMRLVIVGESGSREKTVRAQAELMETARQLGIQEDVGLLGFKANPYPYFAKAAVFVLSSRYEGLPTVLVEAMACGCPVVSTACPGSVEILQHGRYGRLVPIGDAEALAEAIEARLNTPTNGDWLRRRSQDFSAERSVEHYERLFAGGSTKG